MLLTQTDLQVSCCSDYQVWSVTKGSEDELSEYLRVYHKHPTRVYDYYQPRVPDVEGSETKRPLMKLSTY